jgi:predicted nucleic acid-binding protein
MRKAVVIDAGVLTLHFMGDPRVEEYFSGIDDERVSGYMSSVNVAEFYYKTCQKIGRQTADARYYQIKGTRLQIVHDDDLTRNAGLEKCRQPLSLSLADCFALALAKNEKALLLTTDKELSKVKEIDVKFFEV